MFFDIRDLIRRWIAGDPPPGMDADPTPPQPPGPLGRPPVAGIDYAAAARGTTHLEATDDGHVVLVVATDRGECVAVKMDPFQSGGLASDLAHLNNHVGHKWVYPARGRTRATLPDQPKEPKEAK